MRQKIEPTPARIELLKLDEDGRKLNELEAALYVFQKLIDDKVKNGKKGIILCKGTSAEYKMTYKHLQGLLFEISTIFGKKGAFTFGICADCANFNNTQSTDGTTGYCQGKEKCMLDACENFTEK